MIKWKVSPELSDGSSHAIFRTTEKVIEAIRGWSEEFFQDEFTPGDGFSVEAIEMTDQEFENLPEI
jgi:hypothetical protein